MAITDKMRKAFDACTVMAGVEPDFECVYMTKDAALLYLDEIDTEHEALRDQLDTSERQKESYREDLLAANRQVHVAYNDGFDEGFASAGDCLAQHEDAMAEHGWVRLPLDVDEVPWNVGDRDEDGNEVIALKLASDGWFVITDGEWLHRPGKHHYHAPTVEDVLREFALAVCKDEALTIRKGVVEEFAAKLRLAEEEDA